MRPYGGVPRLQKARAGTAMAIPPEAEISTYPELAAAVAAPWSAVRSFLQMADETAGAHARVRFSVPFR